MSANPPASHRNIKCGRFREGVRARFGAFRRGVGNSFQSALHFFHAGTGFDRFQVVTRRILRVSLHLRLVSEPHRFPEILPETVADAALPLAVGVGLAQG
jgi:hypothetical protein